MRKLFSILLFVALTASQAQDSQIGYLFISENTIPLDKQMHGAAGIGLGIKLTKHIGIFAEGEFAKMWDSELYQTTFGINYTFR